MGGRLCGVVLAALTAAGCASNLQPCVSAADCPAGKFCTESFSCTSAANALGTECAPADSVGGLASLQVGFGRVRGDVGPFRGISGEACDMAAYRDGGDFWVNTVVTSPHGPAMSIVGIRGGLGRSDLVPGRTVTFVGDRDVAVNGCAAWGSSNWNFDHQADQVTLSVTDTGNGEWAYAYTAHFPGGADPIYGSFPAQNLTGHFRAPH